MLYHYQPRGVCAREIEIDMDQDVIRGVRFFGGCSGNLQGIGRLLTAGLMQYAANLGVTYMTLEVRRSNETAQNLYRSLGFIQVGVRKKYYEDNGEDALFMVCDHMPPAQEDFEEPETVRE